MIGNSCLEVNLGIFLLLWRVYINSSAVELPKGNLRNSVHSRELVVCAEILTFLVTEIKVVPVFWKHVVCEESGLKGRK